MFSGGRFFGGNERKYIAHIPGPWEQKGSHGITVCCITETL